MMGGSGVPGVPSAAAMEPNCAVELDDPYSSLKAECEWCDSAT